MCGTNPGYREKSLTHSQVVQKTEVNSLSLTNLSQQGELHCDQLDDANTKAENNVAISHAIPPTTVEVTTVPDQDIFYPSLSSEYLYRKPIVHDYHDHANDERECAPKDTNSSGGNSRRTKAKGGVITPFPMKLHILLDEIEKDGHSHIVSWQPHGRCFVVHKPKEFVEVVLPTYFKLTKIASFQRQLNLYGFIRLTAGIDKGGYYHELFLRGKPFLSRKIPRQKIKGTRIRAPCNPDSEPNFYAMSPVNPPPKSHPTKSYDQKKGKQLYQRRCSFVFRPPTKNGVAAYASKSAPSEMETNSSPPALISAETRRAISPTIDPSFQVPPLQASSNKSIHIATVACSSSCASSNISASVITPPRQPRKKLCLPERIMPDCRDDGDDVVMFEGKPFHCLETYNEEPRSTFPFVNTSVPRPAQVSATIYPMSTYSMERDVDTPDMIPSIASNSFEVPVGIEEVGNDTDSSSLSRSPSPGYLANEEGTVYATNAKTTPI